MKRGIAITVRFAGPTNHRGARWIARADHPDGRAVVAYDYAARQGIDNARLAADALVDRWNRDTDGGSHRWAIVAGGHSAPDGYAFVASPVQVCPSGSPLDVEVRGHHCNEPHA